MPDDFVAYAQPATLNDFEPATEDFFSPIKIDAVSFVQEIIDSYNKKRKVPAYWDGKKYQYMNRYAVALALMYATFDRLIPVAPH